MNNNPSIRLGIAITQWNHARLTIKLLEQIISQGSVAHIVICDNGSKCKELSSLINFLSSIEVINHKYQCTVTLLENSVNSGFSSGMNLAIRKLMQLGVDWIWLLNNDISMPNDESTKLYKSISKIKPGIYSTAIFEPEFGEYTGNFHYNIYTSKFKPIRNIEDLSLTPQEKKYVSGANMIVHRDVFDTVGLLNPRTFLYFEELDFIYRARKQGYLQGHIEGLVVQHYGAGSSKGKNMNKVRMYHETWSILDFYANHHKTLFVLILTVRTVARCLTLLISGRHNLITSVLKPTYNFLQNKNSSFAEPKIRNVRRFHFKPK